VTMNTDVFGELSALRKQGRTADALYRLRSELRNGKLAPEEVERAGRILATLRQSRTRDLRVRVLGQCTTSWLTNVLEALSYGRGVEVSVSEGEFDNVIQALSARDLTDSRPEILVFVPWSQRLLSNSARSTSARIAEELAFWQEAWRLAHASGVTRIIQIGYDWVVPGALGRHLGGRAGGDVAMVRELNQALQQALPRDGYFVDLEQVSGITGRLQFYDPRQYHWTRQPFSQRGLVELAHQVFAGIRASTTGAKKVLVVDLDNTLWGGVVGELGVDGIRFGDGAEGEAFLSFQEHLKALARRGVLLAVASKNNMADAREPFEKHRVLLSMSDFAAFEASWEPKATLLQRIASTLGLGLDSFVFFDDNPAEREHIRQALPEVEVVDVPDEPAEYARALQLGDWFESIALTAEDQKRSELYELERLRNESRFRFGSIEEYLASLEMRAELAPLDDADLLRVVQLLGKTNQFNLTTRRHSEEHVRRMLSRAGNICMTARLTDRFGDYGLVACVLALPDEDSEVSALRIDTWLMSCRVIGRTLEQLTLRELASRASALGYRRLIGEYVATSKNQLVADLYTEIGFEPAGSHGETRRYHLALPVSSPGRTFVSIASQEDKRCQ
jgi:FkbH-like protein